MSSYNIAAALPRHGWLRAITSVALLSMACSAATAAPSISGTPPTTVVAAHYFAFQPTVGNPDGKALHFSIINKPSWAQFDTMTGRLAGTPPQSNVGTFANILLGASDGGAFSILPPFAITVLPLPNPPSITGTPPVTVVAGRPYSFQPATTGPSSKTIRFSIVNKPSWAQFDTATGHLTGTPQESNVGTFANILIGANDVGGSAILPSFVVTVLPPSLGSATPPSVGAGSATLSWIPPTRNTDGSALTDLAGYRIYYGKTPELGSAVTLTNAGLTRYVMSGLLQATWYFAMTALDRTGGESARTEVASIAITQ